MTRPGYPYLVAHFMFTTHDEAVAVAREVTAKYRELITSVAGPLLSVGYSDIDNAWYVREIVFDAVEELRRHD